MLEIVAIIFLCMKNAQNAEARGRRQGQAVAGTILLWLSFEFLGLILVMLFLGTQAFLENLVTFALIGALCGGVGGFVSWRIFQTGPVIPQGAQPQGNFTRKEIAMLMNSPQLSAPCMVTLHNENGPRFEFALNGHPIGAAKGGESLTVGTVLAHNLIVATGPGGIRVKNALPLTAPSGGAAQVWFKNGRFHPERTQTQPQPAPKG